MRIIDSTKTSTLDAWLAQPLSQKPVRGFLEGVAAVGKGAGYLRRRRELWRYAVAPVLLNIVITAIVLMWLAASAAWFVSSAHPWFVEKRGDGDFWWAALEIALAVILTVACVGAALLAWKVLGGVLCGFFYNKLAEKVERELGVGEGELRSLSLRYEMVDTLLNVAALLGVNLAFLVIGIVPIVGSAIALVGGAYCNWFILGLDLIAIPRSLRGERRMLQFRFARRISRQTVGLGAVAFVFQFVPIIGAVFLTSAVVGAVLLHRRANLAL